MEEKNIGLKGFPHFSVRKLASKIKAVDPDFDFIRDDARFAEIVGRLNF